MVSKIPMEEQQAAQRPWGPGKTALFRWFAIATVAFIAPVEPLTNLFIPWIGQAVLGIEHEIGVEMTGSGDTTAAYIQLLLNVTAAGLGTIAWTIIAGPRARYRKLLHWITFAVRLAVAISMLTYGLAKISGGQFGSPVDARLLQTYGDSSPMGLLWTFMGHSKVYSSFTGMAEVLGGLLLLSRRTTTLGALVVVGVVANVVMLNFCYDVPVKLYSTRLLVWGLFLLGLDRHRLFAFFTNTGDAKPRLQPPLYTTRRAQVAGEAAKTLTAVAISGALLVGSAFMQPEPPAESQALAGTYKVSAIRRDGVEVPPLLTDSEYWHRVAVSEYGGMTVFSADGVRTNYQTRFDVSAGTVELTRFPAVGGEPDARTWAYSHDPQTHVLVLTADDDSIELEGYEPEFLLRDRGFHWVQEYPYNR